MDGLASGTLTEGGTTMGIGKIGSIIVNIWLCIILMLVLIAASVLTTITTAIMPSSDEPLKTSYYIFIASSVLGWISAATILGIIAVALIFTEGTIILFAPWSIILLAVIIAILCAAIAILNLYALGNSYGSLPFNEGWYAGLASSLAAGGAILAIGFLIVLLALKQKKPPTIENIIIR